MAGALEVLRVIDVSDGVAGGYCTKLLACLGADVLKVERPRIGDSLRRAGPFLGDIPNAETSAPHLHLAAGKRSITLDLATATGAVLLQRLLAHADILIVDEHELRDPRFNLHAIEAIHETLVVTTITPFGLDGPRAAWRSTEIVDLALSGYLSLNGDPDREPVKPYGSQAQFQAGAHAALGTLAALRAREADGDARSAGQRVDVARSEAAGFLLAGALQRESMMRRPQVRNGARPAGFAPNRLYPSTVRSCADGYVHVHCHNRFHDLIAVLMQDPRLDAPDVQAEPLGHAEEIDAHMDAWLATRTRSQAVSEAQELRIPMTEVLDPGEVLADALGQHNARGFFAHVEHPGAGTVVQPGAPVVMPATPWRTARAPLLGEHNVDVFCTELGLKPRALAVLVAAGIV